jgi:hypothetical protein
LQKINEEEINNDLIESVERQLGRKRPNVPTSAIYILL